MASIDMHNTTLLLTTGGWQVQLMVPLAILS
jgi:hypothetical protein